MAIDRKDLALLESILEKNPAFQEKLRSSADVETRVTWCGDIAASNNIPFEHAEFEKLFSAIQESYQQQQISDSELQHIAAGGSQVPVGEMRYLTDDERRWYSFVYGTGVGALVLISNAAEFKSGGAEEFYEAVYYGGKTNLAGHV
jgi:hypothetical protein